MHRPLALAFIVAAFAASGPSRAQLGPGSTEAIQVVDANGAVMGRWDFGKVDFSIGNGMVSVPLSQADGESYLNWSLLAGSTQTIYFTQPRCMGRAWFKGGGAWVGTLPNALVGPDPQGHFMLYVAESPAIKTIPNPGWKSYLSASGCVRDSEIAAGNWAVVYTDAAPIDLTNLFTPPFHLK